MLMMSIRSIRIETMITRTVTKTVGIIIVAIVMMRIKDVNVKCIINDDDNYNSSDNSSSSNYVDRVGIQNGNVE